MENYLSNPRKYNKLLFKFLAFEGDVDYNMFKPDDPIIGYEILRWVVHKINHNPKPGMKMRTIISMRDEDAEVYIQEWYDVTKSDGYINIVHHKESCDVKKEEVDKEVYKDAILATSHRALYNACIDFIIKTK